MNKRITKYFSVTRSFTDPRWSVSERALFAKRLSFLIKANVPLLESMHMLQNQTKSKSKKKVFDVIINDISNGKRLSTSLERFPKMFGDFAINLIKVGEASGILDQNLQHLAHELHKQQALRRKVIGALVYPVFITIATLGVTSLLTVYIFPKLLPIFSSLHVTLPFTTRVLMYVSNYLRNWGLLSLVGIVIFGFIFLTVRASVERFHLLVDRLILKIPLVGKMLKSYNMANICRTLGLLLKSGVRVVESLDITADTTRNLAYRGGLQNIAKGALKGEKISKGLDRHQELFPDITSQMISIGESTGNLPETSLYLAEMYEAEVDESTRNLSTAIEPALMAFMGILVGFVAVSVITPIYSVTQHLTR